MGQSIGGDADFMADDQEVISFHQPTITAYAGLVGRLFVDRFKAGDLLFSFFGWQQPPERLAMQAMGGRCGLTWAVAGHSRVKAVAVGWPEGTAVRGRSLGHCGGCALGHVREQGHLLLYRTPYFLSIVASCTNLCMATRGSQLLHFLYLY